MAGLDETHPSLSEEWHPLKNVDLTPSDVSPGSNRKIWWKASCGHEWEAHIVNRTRLGAGCPFCSNQRVLPGFNDLLSQAPEVAAQWDPDKNEVGPDEVTKKSTKKAHWLCELGHSWEAQISSRSAQGTGCPFCAGRKILPGFNDLETKAPPYLNEWHPSKNLPLTPRQIGPAVAKKLWWRCPEGHDFEMSPHDRSQQQGCPYCSGRKILPGYNDFQTKYPYAAQFWDEERNGYPASRANKSSQKAAWFKCELGHRFRSSTNAMSRIKEGMNGCAVCSGKKLLTGFNDLATRLPEVAKLWHPTKNAPLSPADVTRATTKKVWWRCPDDDRHEWLASVASRSRGQGCPICTSRFVLEGVNDLKTVAPELAAEWNKEKNGEISPSSVTATTPKKAWWRCSKDPRHEWAANIDSRASRGLGCPICSNKKTVSGLNDLGTTHPYLAAEWDKKKNAVQVSMVNAGDHRSFWWLCSKCDSGWKASPINRSRVNSGCPKCAKSGYDATSDGYLYLLSKDNESFQQFGISNKPKARLAKHKLNGWMVTDIIGPLDGYWIVDTETSLKKFFSSQGLLLTREDGVVFDGYTETWRAQEVRFESVSEMLEALREWEWTEHDKN